MKKLLLLSLTLIFSLSLFAQEKMKQKEVGITFYNLDEFGLMYKVGHQKSMWRFNLLSITKDKTEKDGNQFDLEDKTSGFGFSVGKEYRSKLTEDLEFRFGLDLFYERTKSDSDKEFVTSYYNSDYDLITNTKVYTDEITSRFNGFQFVCGLNYVIKDKIVIGAEALPRWGWKKHEVKEHESVNVNGEYRVESTKNKVTGSEFNFSNSNVKLSVAYRF